MCYRLEHPTGFFFNRKYLNEFAEDYWAEYVNPSNWTVFPHESIQAELVFKGKYVKYNTTVWRSTGDETHKKYTSGFDNLKTDGDRWFYPQNCINRGAAYLNQLWKLCEKYSFEIDEKDRYRIYANIILAEQKIGVWRYKAIFETDTLAYHYSVLPRKVTDKEVRKNSKGIVDGILSCIREKEGHESSYEAITCGIVKQSDKKMRKNLLKSRIARTWIVKLLRGGRR